MKHPLALAALFAGALLAAAPAANAGSLPDPLVPRTCHPWTDYSFCTPEVGVPPVPQKCFHWTDNPICIPPN